MANNVKSNTSGFDTELLQFQTQLYDSLVAAYTFDIHGYGRAYKNQTEEGKLPEVWNETEQQYNEVYLDQSKPLSFFFLEDGDHTTNDSNFLIAPIKLVVWVDLNNLDPIVRRDDEIQRQVFDSIKRDVFVSFEITGIQKEVDRIFSGLDTSKIQFSDIQPYHLFAITGRLGYYLTKTCV
jgi:hypothetical protein